MVDIVGPATVVNSATVPYILRRLAKRQIPLFFPIKIKVFPECSDWIKVFFYQL